jgi:hypothetical protein
MSDRRTGRSRDRRTLPSLGAGEYDVAIPKRERMRFLGIHGRKYRKCQPACENDATTAFHMDMIR